MKRRNITLPARRPVTRGDVLTGVVALGCFVAVAIAAIALAIHRWPVLQTIGVQP